MTQTPNSLRRALFAEHEYLDGLFNRLLQCVHQNDREALSQLWTVFEQVIRDHIGWEEAHLLPRYRLEQPDDAASIDADHARFRELIAEIGVAVDLHLIREDIVREMIDLLRSHARREEEQSHAWADENVKGPAAESLLQKVLARMRDAKDATGAGGPSILR
ncbi:MAG: hemerythrin domain-containing protein [Deltaproteobacteria bacterium]